MEPLIASLTRSTINIIVYLPSNPRSVVEIFLMVIVSGNIVILFDGEAISFSRYDYAAYAHFFGGKIVNLDDYQAVFLLSPSSPIARIVGDPKYEAAPLEATFDLSVVSPFQSILAGMLDNRLILFTIIVVPIVGVGAAVYVYVLKRM